MNQLLLKYIRKYERDLTELLRTPGPKTGTMGALHGEEVEHRVRECLGSILPRSTELAAQQVIFDGHDQLTTQAVDLVLLGRDAARFQLDGRPFVAADGVRAALEVKASYSYASRKKAISQLVEIKRLDRARHRVVDVGPWAPPPRGNIFCGALFLAESDAVPNTNGEWDNFVEWIRGATRKAWEGTNGPRRGVGQVPARALARRWPCDSGRYPNFFWFWNRAFVLKRYESGDWQTIRPRPAFESKSFGAPSTTARGGEDGVFYQVWKVESGNAHQPSPLALAAHQFLLQATEFKREDIDWGEYFFSRRRTK